MNADHGEAQADREQGQRGRLVFAAGMFEQLRNALFADAPLESAAFVLCRPVPTPVGEWRFVAYAWIRVSEEHYSARSTVRVDVSATVVAETMQRARAERAAIFAVHTHPFGGPVAPSARDRAGEAVLFAAFQRRIPGIPHGRLILGLDGAHAAYVASSGQEHALTVSVVGQELHELTSSASDAPASGTTTSGVDGVRPDDQDSRFDRQERAFGVEGQRRMAGARIAVIGLGGTGSVVAQQLAHLGVHQLVLIDPDQLETTNLNRVVGARPNDVGRAKVEIARDMILAINPSAHVVCHQTDICDTTVAREVLACDFFMACTDSHGSRAVLSQLAFQYLVPGIDVGVGVQLRDGVVTHVSGRVQMLAPGLPCLLCSHVLDAEAVRRDLLDGHARAADTYIRGAATAVPQPAVISINSSASSMAVTMFLAAITGMPFPARHVRIRFDQARVSPVHNEAARECPVCGEHGYALRGDSWPAPGRPEPAAMVAETGV